MLSTDKIRIQKYLSNLGLMSRRQAEELIKNGQIKINNQIAKLGDKINPNQDELFIKNKKIKPKKQSVYIALNKPIDYISSTSNKQGKTVIDLIIPENNIKPKNNIQIKTKLHLIGRLDKDSEGLIILTNDGELTQKLSHPKFKHEKEYEVLINKYLTKDAQKILKKGMFIDEKNYVKGLKIKKIKNSHQNTLITVILTEGKNRQIRKMFERLGYKVLSLKRTRINKLRLGNLPIGRWRLIKKDAII